MSYKLFTSASIVSNGSPLAVAVALFHVPCKIDIECVTNGLLISITMESTGKSTEYVTPVESFINWHSSSITILSVELDILLEMSTVPEAAAP